MGRLCQHKLLSQATVEFLFCSIGGFSTLVLQEVVFEQGEKFIAFSLVGTRFAPSISILMSEGDTWVGKVLNEGLVDKNNCSSNVAPDSSSRHHQSRNSLGLGFLNYWITGTLGDQRNKAEKEHITTMDKQRAAFAEEKEKAIKKEVCNSEFPHHLPINRRF
jgi:hypothetical protein